jgi:hypothetical protein
MVNRRTEARLSEVILSGVSRQAQDLLRKELNEALRPGEVAVRRGDLDFAIAQVSNALRALLDLEVHGQETPTLRSEVMMTESSNANERYDVFVVENYEDDAGAEKANWTRVGVAFPHKDSDGLNVELRAIPVSGKLVIRRHVVKPRAAGEKGS